MGAEGLAMAYDLWWRLFLRFGRPLYPRRKAACLRIHSHEVAYEAARATFQDDDHRKTLLRPGAPEVASFLAQLGSLPDIKGPFSPGGQAVNSPLDTACIPGELLWRRSTEAPPAGALLAVAISNSEGQPSTGFQIGEWMVVRVYFRPDPQSRAQISVELKNKYNQVVCLTGSHWLGIEPPDVPSDAVQAFELRLQCAIRSGQYSLDVKVSSVGSHANLLEQIDCCQGLGPILVRWNYDTEKAPFLGLFGLPAEGRFLESSCECMDSPRKQNEITPAPTSVREQPHRVVLLTFHKCGSQWVRDVLSAPEIARHSGFPLVAQGIHPGPKPIPDLPLNSFSGPLYDVHAWTWTQWKRYGDRAVVVLRDPRDIVVSWVFSLTFSHREDTATILIREQLLEMDIRRRIKTGIFQFTAARCAFWSWGRRRVERDIFVTAYEDLIRDEQKGFRDIIKWLGWGVPEEVVAAAVERLSFRTRSGRNPGDLDISSHYRLGLAGDWVNYFDRELGRLWEERHPGLLAETGYALTNDWWKELPESVDYASDPIAPLHEVVRLRAELTRLREEGSEMARELKVLRDLVPQ